MKLIVGMHGLGDNIYQRAVVREMGPVHLVTSWPQFYQDLPNVQCLRAETGLRTQRKNIRRGWKWSEPLNHYDGHLYIGYDGLPGTILERFLHKAGQDPHRPLTFDMPRLSKYVQPPTPYVVVRPATVRKEWPAAARNPDPMYLVHAARAAKAAGYRVICIADLLDGSEEAAGILPPYDTGYIYGELPVEQVMGLVQDAAGVIGGVGWLLPAALAYRVPMLCIWGGWGTPNGPQRVLDPRLDVSKLVQAVPDAFCMCNDRDHLCNKTINDFERYVDEFLRHAGSSASASVAP